MIQYLKEDKDSERERQRFWIGEKGKVNGGLFSLFELNEQFLNHWLILVKEKRNC